MTCDPKVFTCEGRFTSQLTFVSLSARGSRQEVAPKHRLRTKNRSRKTFVILRLRAISCERSQSSPSRMVPIRCFRGSYQVVAIRWRKKWRNGLTASSGSGWQMAGTSCPPNTPPARMAPFHPSPFAGLGSGMAGSRRGLLLELLGWFAQTVKWNRHGRFAATGRTQAKACTGVRRAGVASDFQSRAA